MATSDRVQTLLTAASSLLVNAGASCAIYAYLQAIPIELDGFDPADSPAVARIAASAAARWTLASAFVGGVGVAGVLTTNPSLLRAFAVGSLFDLLSALFLLFSTVLLAFSPTLGPLFSELVCGELSRGEIFRSTSLLREKEGTWGLSGINVLMWGVEACEDNWREGLVLVVAFALLAVVVRAYGMWATWEFIAQLEKKVQSEWYEVRDRKESVSRSKRLPRPVKANSLPLDPRPSSHLHHARFKSHTISSASSPSSQRPRLVLVPVFDLSQQPPTFTPGSDVCTSPSELGFWLIALIAVSLAGLHLYLASACSHLQSSLERQLEEDEDNGGEWRKLEAIRLLLGVGRLLSLTSFGISLGGLVGVVRDNVGLIRIFLLDSFFSLGGELILLALVSLLTFSSMSSSSFSASLCEALAHSDLNLDSVLGMELESCEERWKQLATGLTGFVAAVALMRLWSSLQILSYYTALTKRQRRSRTPLSINTSHVSDNGHSRDFASPGGTKRSSGSGGGGGQRIFLLPKPMDAEEAVPLLTMTPSSPLASFPPQPFAPSAPVASTSAGGEQQYVVYAPVMMTAEQAMQLNAREVVTTRPRSRSYTFSPVTPTGPSISNLPLLDSSQPTSEDDAKTIVLGLAGSGSGKGKQA
ncbi:hypothetical protein MNV49_003938 [Pseudohyphozyma bogoriensis]|nr:hypothetical protein MNV49_003938 [Pseudohyphozyma bogoriensis]